MDIVAGGGAPGDAGTHSATSTVITLNDSMFGIYEAALMQYRRNLLAQHPIVLGLFSTEGGRFTLYRPGSPPLEAPLVPPSYQVLKAISHSSLVLFELVGPYFNDVSNPSWVAPMVSYLAQTHAAIQSLDAVELAGDVRANARIVLEKNAAYMQTCLEKRTFSYEGFATFANDVARELRNNVRWAAGIQVGHWMNVVAEWKALLGDAWSRTYAASNTLYVTRQNNVLYGVLAQFFEPDAINDRLFMFETAGFATANDDMLMMLTRIISDRAAGEVFFGNYYLMDYELMGGDARDCIAAESRKRGLQVHLPPLVPFGSRAWPFITEEGAGPGSLDQLEHLASANGR
jgi:hypothetical protein